MASGSYANLGTQSGVQAQGSYAGGSFTESDSAAQVNLAYNGVGIAATGPTYGAFFGDTTSTGYAYMGEGATGVQGYGATRGGYFARKDGTSSVTLADGAFGLKAVGTASTAPGAWSNTGYFELKDLSGATTLATAQLAASYKTTDPESTQLRTYGARFDGPAYGSRVEILPNNYDPPLRVTGGPSHYTVGDFYTAEGGSGISAAGGTNGGYFVKVFGGNWAYVAQDTYKIFGSGSVAFTQNHPTEKDKIIVYNSPEGDEVATYTRGTARLVGGEARIRLGETFAWVTNPDLGLTAYVTPVGEWADLYVVSKSTKELVVRSRVTGSPDVEFDYMVYGLRIGFEETSIVQKKEQEAFIPSMAGHRKRYADHPELRRFNALERVKLARAEMGLEKTPDLSASRALKEAIHEFDPNIDPPLETPALKPRSQGRDAAASGGNVRDPLSPANPSVSTAVLPMALRAGEARSALLPAGAGVASRSGDPVGANSGAPVPPASLSTPEWSPEERLRVSEPVRAGELLAIDSLDPERVRRAEGIADPRFVGVAAKDSSGDEVILATSRIIRVWADAASGAILPGDLLTTSPVPGLAMRAENPARGAVFGKALDPLEGGTGEIRVLWMTQ